MAKNQANKEEMMFTAKDYAMPQSLEEAYEVLTARKTNHIVAGCAWAARE